MVGALVLGVGALWWFGRELEVESVGETIVVGGEVYPEVGTIEEVGQEVVAEAVEVKSQVERRVRRTPEELGDVRLYPYFAVAEAKYGEFFGWIEGELSREELGVLKELLAEMEYEESEFLRSDAVRGPDFGEAYSAYSEEYTRKVVDLLDEELATRFERFRKTMLFRPSVRKIAERLEDKGVVVNETRYERMVDAFTAAMLRLREVGSSNGWDKPVAESLSEEEKIKREAGALMAFREVIESEFARALEPELAVAAIEAFYEENPGLEIGD